MAGIALAATSCGGGAGPGEKAPADTPVILVSIDTLRADRLPIYGYTEVETPNIDRLRADGVLFERAYSPIPLTLPSHVSMFTGMLPTEHGVRDNDGYTIDPDALPLLQRQLAAAGYATGGAVSSWVLRGLSGISSGFDFWEDSLEFGTGLAGLGGLQRPGAETLELALPWLRSVADGPFFFFFHMYEPHAPYEPPPPYDTLYESPYDGEVAAADAVLGRLIAELESLGLYDRSLFVLTSDHGEGLMDHGEEEHGVLLYREAIEVPLVIKLPSARRAGESISTPVQLADLAPTVLSLLGLELPAASTGRSLFSLGDGAEERPIYAETFYPRLHYGWSEQLSLVRGRFHYIEGPSPELYDIVADPGETSDLLRQEGPTAAEMRAQLGAMRRELAAPTESDQETQRQLAALGYLGRAAVSTGEPLPDPRPHLGVLEDLKNGFRYFRRQQYEEAVELYRRILADHPAMLDAWEQLTLSLQALGRLDEALAAYQEALSISGAQHHLALAAGQLLLRLGRLEDARQHALLAREANPAFAYELLAKVALAEGDLDEAESQARLAVDKRGTRVEPLITLAFVLAADGRFAETIEVTRQVEREFEAKKRKAPEVLRGLYLIQGKALASVGRSDEAARALSVEIERFPDQLEAYTQLAILGALENQPSGAIVGLLQRMVESNPTPEAYAAAVRTLSQLGDAQGATELLRYARGRFPDSRLLVELAG